MRIIILIIALSGLGMTPAYAAQTAADNMAQAGPATLFSVMAIIPSPDHLSLAANDKPTRKPSNGMTMRRVKRLFGEPSKEIPSAGKPPITRWVYEEFTVYFEGKRVIHSVTNRSLSGKPVKG